MTHNILVTGGAGYIGSHACKLLAQQGYCPIAFDNLSTGWEQAVKFGPFVQGDLQDRAALDAVFAAYQPLAVMHFAALSQVGEASIKPVLYWRNNFLGSLTLIEAMAEANCRNIVFSSTCAVYGNQDGVVLNENSAKMPMNAYGASKLAVEHMIHDCSKIFDLNYVIFRYFNVAGADPEAMVGEWHQPETHLIPSMIAAAAGDRPPLTIYGKDYPTPDGTCIRDYVHVMDLVRAHLLGLQWLRDGKESRAFNLGSGKGFSVAQVLAQCEATLGCSVPHVYGERRAGDASMLVSGSKRAVEELGWVQENASLSEMIVDAYRWYQKGGYEQL